MLNLWYNNCILCVRPLECWVVTKRDVLKIDAVNQWYFRKLLGIWHCHVLIVEVRWTTKQLHCLAVVQARHLSLFDHIA